MFDAIAEVTQRTGAAQNALIGQRVPDGAATAAAREHIIAYPVLGGLNHDYRRAA